MMTEKKPFLIPVTEPALGSARRLLAAMGLASVAGLSLSAELTRVHIRIHTDPSYHALCDLGGDISCGAVALSPYSVWFGAPISAWGFLVYLTIAWLAFQGMRPGKPHEAWPSGFLLGLSAAACLASLGLSLLSHFVIKAQCLYCSGLHIVNAALLFLAVANVEKQRLSPAEAFRRDLFSRLGSLRMPLTAAFTVLAAAVFLSLYWPKYWANQRPGVPASDYVGVTEKGEHWIGAKIPTVTILEYTDYECPLCRRAHWKLRAMLSRHADQVRLVHKHFPLESSCNSLVTRPFHLNACRLSAFVSSAGLQGKFWQTNDAVFSALETTSPGDLSFKRIAVVAGLDLPRLYAGMSARSASEAIRNDVAEGIRLGVKGTPTYFVNGVRYEGFIPEGVLAETLRSSRPISRSPPENRLAIGKKGIP